MRDAGVVADLYEGEGVEPGVLADPRVVADLQVPGVFDVDGGFEHHPLSYSRAEQAEDDFFGSGRGIERVLEEEGVDEMPECAGQEAAAGVVP